MRWLGVKSATIPTARELLRLVYVGRTCLAIAIYVTTALKVRVAAPPDILASSLILVLTAAVTVASYWHTHFRAKLPGPTFLYLQAVFDVLLFADNERYSAGDLLWARRRPYHAVVLIAFVALPALSFVNLWDSYLSAALYSGNLTEGVIYLSNAGRAALTAPVAEHVVRSTEDTHVLNLQRWAAEDLNVFPYPETRVYRVIAKYVCGQMSDRRGLVLLVREQRMFRSRPETGYRCPDL